METAERWLDAMWPFVSRGLPTSAEKVLEIGCGHLGGFVPRLRAGGYEAVGIDPEAPPGMAFRRIKFEDYEPTSQVDVVVASLSLHHVADLSAVLEATTATLAPGGSLIVLEWASERFDQATAQWCFQRLTPVAPDDDSNWLRRHHDRWQDSRQAWSLYFSAWLQEERLHPSDSILDELDARFDRQSCAYGPYFFPDLSDTTMAEEQAAIDANQIQATGIRYTAQRR